MSIKYKKVILSAIVLGLIPHVGQAAWDWLSTESWKEWVHEITKKETTEKEGTEAKREPEEKKEKTEEKKEAADNLPPLENVEEMNPELSVNFYDSLDIEYFPDRYLSGNEATLRKYINTLFKNGQNDQAVAFFISLERKNHTRAISLLKSMVPENRFIILMEAPKQFVAKILTEMRNIDFKGQLLFHWGNYNLQSKHFGANFFNSAMIKGESVSLRYIDFLLSYNIESKKKDPEIVNRVHRLAEILSCASGPDLVSLLVYSKDEVLVKIGDNDDVCFAELKTKGMCDEETPINLDTRFVGYLLNYMHTMHKITDKDLVNVLVMEFNTNRPRFEPMLSFIDIEIIKKIANYFPEEILPYLPDRVILDIMESYKESEKVLKIEAGKNSSNSSTVILIETTDKVEDEASEDNSEL